MPNDISDGNSKGSGVGFFSWALDLAGVFQPQPITVPPGEGVVREDPIVQGNHVGGSAAYDWVGGITGSVRRIASSFFENLVTNFDATPKNVVAEVLKNNGPAFFMSREDADVLLSRHKETYLARWTAMTPQEQGPYAGGFRDFVAAKLVEEGHVVHDGKTLLIDGAPAMESNSMGREVARAVSEILVQRGEARPSIGKEMILYDEIAPKIPEHRFAIEGEWKTLTPEAKASFPGGYAGFIARYFINVGVVELLPAAASPMAASVRPPHVERFPEMILGPDFLRSPFALATRQGMALEGLPQFADGDGELLLAASEIRNQLAAVHAFDDTLFSRQSEISLRIAAQAIAALNNGATQLVNGRTGVIDMALVDEAFTHVLGRASGLQNVVVRMPQPDEGLQEYMERGHQSFVDQLAARPDYQAMDAGDPARRDAVTASMARYYVMYWRSLPQERQDSLIQESRYTGSNLVNCLIREENKDQPGYDAADPVMAASPAAGGVQPVSDNVPPVVSPIHAYAASASTFAGTRPELPGALDAPLSTGRPTLIAGSGAGSRPGLASRGNTMPILGPGTRR